MLSSHDAEVGQRFTFVVDQDVLTGGVNVIPHCTTGIGTVTLAGRHGINGHEGDLHLRFDSLTLPDGTVIPLDPLEQQFAGKDRKTLAIFTTRWINGDDVEVPTDKILTIETASDVAAKPEPAPACPIPSPKLTPGGN